MSKYFDDADEWEPESKEHTGLPRPYKEVEPSLFAHKFSIKPKVPIPWQSYPIFSTRGAIEVIKENEARVFSEDLCAYCGLKIKDNETVIRWKSEDDLSGKYLYDPKKNTRVASDIHPFHLECMEQARTFCPFMHKTLDEEFETGLYSDLKIKALKVKEGLEKEDDNAH
jgi:hypothetical protein